MSVLRRAAALLLLLACFPIPRNAPSEKASAPQSGGPTEQDLSFLGGGRILYLVAPGPGYGWGQVGIIDSDGTARHYPRDRHAFPYWDPAAPDRLLMLPWGSDPTTRSFEIDGDSLVEVGSWHTAELSTYPSLDGSTIAFTPIDRSGRPRWRVLRLIDRSSGLTRNVSSKGPRADRMDAGSGAPGGAADRR
jgi:hypothetical protein